MKLSWRGWLLLTLFLLPWLGALGAGLWWLWLHDGWLPWLAAVTATTLLLWAGRRWWTGQLVELPETSAANPTWPRREEDTWAQLQPQIQALSPEAYPLDKDLPDKLLHLGLTLSLEVAQLYYPDSSEPRLAVPLPELIHAAERVCRDIRQLSEQVPFSHAITAEQLLNLHDYYQRYGEKAKRLLRLGGLLISPQGQVLNEIRQLALGEQFDLSRQDILRWILHNYAQWVVRHAIDLYSGHQKGALLPPELSETTPEAPPQTPLRLLVLGQTNTGKSSLINALFGDVTATADSLPTTQGFTAYQLTHDDLPPTLIHDSAGYGQNPPQGLETELAQADCVLLLCKANEAARQPDQSLMAAFHDYFRDRPDIAPPPLLVLCTHIDQLPPFREWQPPYNIATPQRAKEHNIRAAMEVLAEELPCALDDIIPVTLHRPYNLEEGVIPALLQRLPEAKRSQYTRNLRRHESSAFWRQLGRQALSSGRVLSKGIASLL